MADSVDAAIGELPQAEYIDDSDRIPMEQGGVAKYVLGAMLKAFIDRNILGVRALTLPVGSDVTASYNAETGVLTLGIPRSLGAANSVDGVAADTSGDVPLGAVSYDRGQSLTDAQKTRVLANLGLSFINLLGGTIALDGFTVKRGGVDFIDVPSGTIDLDGLTVMRGSDQVYPFQSGDSYCKLPDGTLIQWGVSSGVTASGSLTQIASSGVYNGALPITFPIAFADADNVSVHGTFRYSNGIATPIALVSVSSTSASVRVFDFYARPLNDGLITLRWLAVGRWK